MATMLPKHYEGFRKAFPDLVDSDFEKLFASGIITPGKAKKSSEEELVAAGLTKTKAGKVKKAATPPE